MNAPYYQDDLVTLWHGDCVAVMRELPDASVDAVVTDPPYELGFMGKGWDASGIAYNPEVWGNALRILKPGGHLLAFGGTRTWHRLAVAIEDAGFEVRDSIAWMYGSGFPKSLDVSKAIDRKRDDRQESAVVASYMLQFNPFETVSQYREYLNEKIVGERHAGGSAQGWTTTDTEAKVKPRVPTWDQWLKLKSLLGFGDDMDAEVWRLNGRKGQPGEAWAEREVTGTHGQSTAQQVWMQNYSDHVALPPKERKDKPATPAAQQWQGWGTALKPAFEPIVVARKPLIGTVAENVLAHGTGALNIDGARICTDDKFGGGAKATSGFVNGYEHDGWHAGSDKGRWPANVILDESQAAELDRQSGQVVSGGGANGKSGGIFGNGQENPNRANSLYQDTGGASRFFYVAKANKKERPRAGDTAHPTVKPLELMRYLVKLVTSPGGTVLEPFAGSGTTLEACVIEGFNAIGIELTEDYLPLITQRLCKPIEQVLL